MKKQSITFSGFQLFFNESLIEKKDISKYINEETDSKAEGSKIYIFNYMYRDEFLTISFSDGSSIPRPDYIYENEHDKIEKKENPRKNNQIEPKNHFCLIDFKNAFLWLSNSRKKSLISENLNEKCKPNILTLKDVYDKEEFIKILKTLNHLKLKGVPELFDEVVKYKNALMDDLYGAVEAELILKYDDSTINHIFKGRIRDLLDQKEHFKSISISGKDSKNLGMLFNNNIFSRRITFDAQISQNGLFSEEEVYKNLIGQVLYERNN